MEFRYENQAGSLCFCGGGGLWNITDVSGLGLVEKSFQVVSYAMTEGQITLSEKATARHITLRGDCRADRAEISRGVRVLNQKGYISLLAGSVTRRIEAYCSHFEMEKPRHGLRTFIIQFTADDPYFEGAETMCRALYSREDLISSSFTLPCVFTKGITDCMVCNDGDVRCEPVFTVMCKKVGENTDQHGFSIQNHTTGHSLQLEYDMAKNEMITIDIAKRQIVSNLQTEDNYNGNLIYFLSDDSFLHTMFMEVGDNHFSTVNYSGADMIIRCEVKEKHLEAVI